MANRKKDLKVLVKKAARQGWQIKDTKSGCLMYVPDGIGIVPIHWTPSCHRYLRHTAQALSRHGFRN
jgi:hypothetical protein